MFSVSSLGAQSADRQADRQRETNAAADDGVLLLLRT